MFNNNLTYLATVRDSLLGHEYHAYCDAAATERGEDELVVKNDAGRIIFAAGDTVPGDEAIRNAGWDPGEILGIVSDVENGVLANGRLLKAATMTIGDVRVRYEIYDLFFTYDMTPEDGDDIRLHFIPGMTPEAVREYVIRAEGLDPDVN